MPVKRARARTRKQFAGLSEGDSIFLIVAEKTMGTTMLIRGFISALVALAVPHAPPAERPRLLRSLGYASAVAMVLFLAAAAAFSCCLCSLRRRSISSCRGARTGGEARSRRGGSLVALVGLVEELLRAPQPRERRVEPLREPKNRAHGRKKGGCTIVSKFLS